MAVRGRARSEAEWTRETGGTRVGDGMARGPLLL